MKTRASIELLLVESAPGSLGPLAALAARLGAEPVTVTADAPARPLAAGAVPAAICIDARASPRAALDFARGVRRHSACAATPLVFVTGRELGGFPLEEAAALGDVDLLAEPGLAGYADAKLALLIERARRHAEPPEEALRETEARLRLVTEATGLGVWRWDPVADRAVWENERPSEIFGMKPSSEPPGAARFLAEFVHPADVDRLRRRMARAMRTHARVHQSCRIHRRSDGALRWIEITARSRAMCDGRLWLLGTLADVTERRQAEAALRSSEELYRTVIASMDEGFCLVDVLFDDDGAPCDYCFLEVNAAFEHQTGLKDAVGRRIRELVPEHEPHWWQVYGRVAQTGEPVRFVNEAKGLGRWYDVYAARLGAEGSRKVAVLFSDITERRRAEDELHRLADALACADRRKNEFLATLAHELRNPLAPLRNGLRLMRVAADRPEVVEPTRAMMERQLAHMVHLVDDLLDVARISSGKLHLRLQRVELQSVVDSAIETCGARIEGRRQTLGLDLPSAALWLRADPVRLSQVLSNLLHNASKYTHEGGHIGLSAVPEGEGAVRITVHDDGAGIGPELLPSVFDMFAQGGRSTDSLHGGLGIGLALVRRLVEQHGGTVTAESAGPGRGSAFHVGLPLDSPPQQAPAPAATPAPVAAPPEPVRRLRVLVADDNADSAETLAMVLETEGHELQIAHDGAEALRMALDWRPDVAILDIGMPGLDGHEVAEALRRTPGLEGIALLAVTGWGSPEDRARSAASGFDVHLTKPVDPLQVLQVLARLRAGDRALAAHA